MGNPTANKEETTTVKPTHSSALNIVLQWLVYVFWFWTLAVLGTVLSGVLIDIFVDSTQDSTWIIYAAAPLVVLLPLASVSDRYYKKVEPREKHGFAAVVMVVNAIIAALCAVGAVVAIVYALLDLVLSTRADTTGNTVALLVSFVIATLSSLFFIRVLYIERFRFIRKRFTQIVLAIALVSLLLVIVFPLVDEVRRKSDRIVEDNYRLVTRAIDNYVSENSGRLPASLDQVDFKDGAKRAVDTGKITYKPLSLTSNGDSIDELTTTILDIGNSSSSRNRDRNYELCVDWDYERDNRYDYPNRSKSYSSSYGHEAGTQCYSESAYYYNR